MCGIVGIVGAETGAVDHDALRTMCGLLRHRGPDDEGFYFGDRVGLGMRRLSIIDVAGGRQPVTNEDRSIWVVFNGEIYNYRALRTGLEARGHHLSSRSDTECIVHLYEDYGDECVHHLRGMFAFALWDDRRKRLLLARDRFGIKPLYYCRAAGGLAFSSEIKSLLVLEGVEQRINLEALSAFFTFGYVPGPNTMYDGIHELPPAHVATWTDGKLRLARYWDVKARPDYTKSVEDFSEELLRLLEESVKLHLESDVQLGAFLSGGLDSSTIVALMARTSPRQVKTFTIGFADAGIGVDERRFARTVAEKFDTDHSEQLLSPDIRAILPQIIHALDEPFADMSVIPTFVVCQAARKSVTVALSGLGGDELFAGYERYRGALLADYYRRLPRALRAGLDRTITRLREPRNGGSWTPRLKRFIAAADLDLDARYRSYITTYDESQKSDLFNGDLMHELQRRSASVVPPSMPEIDDDVHALDRMLLADMQTYLPYDLLRMTDRLSMCHSLEVRVPFLDHKLVEFAATIPAHLKLNRLWRKKFVLVRAVRDVLPAAILRRRKQGFTVPLNNWLRGPLRDLVESYLGESGLRSVAMFNARTVGKLLQEHDQRVKDHESRLWTLLMFMLWHDQQFSRRPESVMHA